MENKSRYVQNATFAYKRFGLSYLRTELMLEVGLLGLENRIEEWNKIISKLEHAEQSAAASDSMVRRLDDGGIQLTLTGEEKTIITKVSTAARDNHLVLDAYIYSILIVFIWGVFETYFSMLFEELYTKRPEMLKSKENITFAEIIDHLDNPMDVLVKKELHKIGLFRVYDLFEYLENKTNITLEDAAKIKLSEVYLVRNIIAHNTGIVRSELRYKLPASITISNNEIVVTKAYLAEVMETIRDNIYTVEIQVQKKFFKSE